MIVACANQQVAVNVAPTNTSLPEFNPTFIAQLNQYDPFPRPYITATPVPVSQESQDINKLIGEYYKVTKCITSLLGASDEQLSLVDITSGVDFSRIEIREVADSTDKKYRAYYVYEPAVSNNGYPVIAPGLYLQNLLTKTTYKINWNGYVSSLNRIVWIGENILAFEQDLLPWKIEIAAIDMEKLDFVYHITYAEKCTKP